MTSEVEIEIFPWLSQALGKKSRVVLSEKVNVGENLKTLLERIASEHDGFGAMIYDVKHGTVYDTVVIFVNNLAIKNLRLKVKGEDRITITPFYSGG
jgi:molybdopterin converting factor small subunit